MIIHANEGEKCANNKKAWKNPSSCLIGLVAVFEYRNL
jgi:hypothetical protein